MIIKMPKRYYKYIKMLVQAKCVLTEEDAKIFLFENGLSEAEFDASYAGAPDIVDMSVIQGRQMTIEIPDKTEYLQRLEFVSRAFGVPYSKTTTIIIVLGLGNTGYLSLKGSQLYRKDKQFRREVDEMPHDVAYDVIQGESAVTENIDDNTDDEASP